jgi:hypothetical protein
MFSEKSKKLRALMNFVSIEAPSARVALARELPEFLNASLRVIAASQLLQVVADHLIETFAQGIRLLPGTGDELFING